MHARRGRGGDRRGDAPLLDAGTEKAAPGNAALLVVDVQNDFVADGGFFDRIGADVKTVQKAIPNLVRLIDKAREAGVPGDLRAGDLRSAVPLGADARAQPAARSRNAALPHGLLGRRLLPGAPRSRASPW